MYRRVQFKQHSTQRIRFESPFDSGAIIKSDVGAVCTRTNLYWYQMQNKKSSGGLECRPAESWAQLSG
jgi:hypothetical protein